MQTSSLWSVISDMEDCLTNIRAHAGAAEATVVLCENPAFQETILAHVQEVQVRHKELDRLWNRAIEMTREQTPEPDVSVPPNADDDEWFIGAVECLQHSLATTNLPDWAGDLEKQILDKPARTLRQALSKFSAVYAKLEHLHELDAFNPTMILFRAAHNDLLSITESREPDVTA